MPVPFEVFFSCNCHEILFPGNFSRDPFVRARILRSLLTEFITFIDLYKSPLKVQPTNVHQ